MQETVSRYLPDPNREHFNGHSISGGDVVPWIPRGFPGLSRTVSYNSGLVPDNGCVSSSEEGISSKVAPLKVTNSVMCNVLKREFLSASDYSGSILCLIFAGPTRSYAAWRS